MTRARDLADGADKDITGTLTLDDIVLSNDMSVADNGKVQFGAGNDLQIYHDGSNSVIKDNGTGKLILDTDGTSIEFQKSGLETLATFNTDGAITLYHDNSAKLATTSTGVDVTGTVTADGLTVEGSTAPTINIKSTDAVVVADDVVGAITFEESDATGGTGVQAFIKAIANDSGNTYDMSIGVGGNTEAIRVDQSGNVGIGGSDTLLFNGVGGSMKLVVIGDDSATTVTNNSDAGIAIVNTNQTAGNLAGLHFARADTDDSPNYAGASIVARFPDAQVTGQYPKGELAFLTSSTANAAPSEKMRIDSSGGLRLGTTSNILNAASDEKMSVKNAGLGHAATFQVTNVTGGFPILYLDSQDTANTSQNTISIRRGGSQVGGITTSASSTAYNTTSDHRLKENVADMTGAIDRVKSLQPKRFNFIADDSVTVDGFMAHEAQAVVPEAVTGTHNEVDADGNAVMQGIDQSKLVPLLTGALQEAIAKIETLETKVAALEAGN